MLVIKVCKGIIITTGMTTYIIFTTTYIIIKTTIIIITEMSWCGGGLVVDNPEEEKMRRVEERMEEVEN